MFERNNESSLQAVDVIEKGSPDFELEAILKDEATGKFYCDIFFKSIAGKKSSVRVGRQLLGDFRSFKRTLLDQGAVFANADQVNRDALQEIAAGAVSVRVLKAAKRTGWRNKRRRFVMPQRVLGRQPEDAQIIPPAFGTSHRCRTAGSLDAWKSNVATPAAESSRLIFAICAGLAAPLLHIAKVPSFGALVFSPKAKIGKSTMLVVAASVVGMGKESDLPNFGATDSARAEQMAAFNDLLLPINELGLLKGGPADRHRRLSDFSYVLGEGNGTAYSRFAQKSMGAGPSHWRCIALGTGEQSSEEVAQQAGAVRNAGAGVRWIDLPATSNGVPDLFDFAEAVGTEADRLTWFEAQCQSLRRHCSQNHGVALEHFLMHVMTDHKRVKDRLQRLGRDFAEEVGKNELEPAARHMAMCLGLVYAAGIEGIECDVLPWKKQRIKLAIKRCYRDARQSLKFESDLVRDAMKRFCKKISGDALVSAKSNNSADLAKADGFVKRRLVADRVVVRGDAYKKWFDDPRQPALLLAHLQAKGVLAGKMKHQKAGRPSIVAAESQTSWPDGTRPRSIVFNLPTAVRQTGKWPEE